MATPGTYQKLERAFRRERNTGSTYPQQATDCLAEIDQAQPGQDLENVGAVR